MDLHLFGGVVKSTPFNSRYWLLADPDSKDWFKSGMKLTLTIVGQYVTVVGDSQVDDMVQEAVTALAMFARNITVSPRPEPVHELAKQIHDAMRRYFQDYNGIRTNKRIKAIALPNHSIPDEPDGPVTRKQSSLLIGEDPSLALIDRALDFASLPLPPQTREVLVEFLDSKTTEQVAERLGLSVRTVQRRMNEIYLIAERHFR